MRGFTLKTRVTFILPLAITVVLAYLLFLIHTLLQSYIIESISNHQFQTVSILADDIDRNMAAQQEILLAIARSVNREIAGNPERALHFLQGKSEHLLFFDNGLFLFDPQGRMIAELPLGLQRSGKDFSFRDYLHQTLVTRKPGLSDPYLSSQSHHHPAIMFTVPILEKDGSIVAVLGGSVDLTKTSFLGMLTDVKIGKTGYVFLFNRDRLIILHPDTTRIMQKDIPAGANKLLDAAIDGFEGTNETVNSRGLQALTSFKQLKTKNWIIGANYPTAEAYAPVKRQKLIFLIVLPLLSLAIFWPLRRYLSRFTDPIARLTRHVEELTGKTGEERIFVNCGEDEVAILGQAFNGLIREVDRHQEELTRREVLYRTVVDFSSEMVYWVAPDRQSMRYMSPSCLELTGHPGEAFYTNPSLLNEIIHPLDRGRWERHCQLAGQDDFNAPLEFRIVVQGGQTRWVNHLCRPVYDQQGEYVGIRGSFSDITLWKAAETALSASEEKFRLFFEEASDAIFIVDATGKILVVNDEACLRYGFSHGELIGQPIADFDCTDEAVHTTGWIDQVFEHEAVTFETEHRRKGALPLPVEVNARLIRFEGETVILAVARDITERKRANELLHRQNEYLVALHDTTLGLMRRLDLTSLLQAIVSRAGKLVGTEHCYLYLIDADHTTMRMVVQSGIYDSLAQHPVRIGEGVAGRVWSTGEALHVDDYRTWEGRLPDPGRDSLCAMAGVPLKSGDELVGVLGLAFVDPQKEFTEEKLALLTQFGELASLALDNARLYDAAQRELTVRKKTEEHLRKLSVAVEQSPASIVITDTDGAIEYVNPHFCALTGYSLEEAVGQNPRILKSGKTTAAEYRQLWETILAGGEWCGEFLNRKKNGDLYWEQALIAPIRDEQGVIRHFIAIKENITERKQLEGQLRHSQKMEAIGQLAGGIAHDFNNILTAIIGYASIMQLKLPADSPLRRSAEQITITAERGASLTQGLLAFSRKQVSNPVVINLNEILQRVEQLLLRLISEDIRLQLNLAPQLLPVMADSAQIEQVLMNLATNARDALPKGGRIDITSAAISLDREFAMASGFGAPGDYVLLTVTDSGLGMDEETLRHIFEPFYTTKELGKGTGLGLSIVYGIIKKHGGYIACDSAPGVGTTFRIYLPLLDAVPVGEVAPLPEEALPKQGRAVILLAEDSESARHFMKDILEEFGYTVLEAGDGQEALDLYLRHRETIDLLLLDVIMPMLKGREVYDAVRKIDPQKKVLFCSGYTNDTVSCQGGVHDGMDYLPKPFTPKELLMKIREVLEDGE